MGGSINCRKVGCPLHLLQVNSTLAAAFELVVAIATSLAGPPGEEEDSAEARTALARLLGIVPKPVLQRGKAARSRQFWKDVVLGSWLPVMKVAAADAEARSGYEPAAARLRAAQALAELPCSNPLCMRICGASEARLRRGRRCGGCRVARFCCEACRDAAWPAHAAVCAQLAAAAAAAGGD